MKPSVAHTHGALDLKGTIQRFAYAQLTLQISIPVPSCTGSVVLRGRCVLGLPQHLRCGRSVCRRFTTRARSRPGRQTHLSRSQTSSLTMPTSGVRVLIDQSDCSKPHGRHLNHDITGRLFKLTSRSKCVHMAVG